MMSIQETQSPGQMAQIKVRRWVRGGVPVLMATLAVALGLLLAGCQPAEQAKPLLVGAELIGVDYLTIATVVTSSTEAGTPVVETITGSLAETATVTTAETTPEPNASATAMVTTTVDAADTNAGAGAATPEGYSRAMPVTLSIPALDLRVPVVPMGWELVLINGKTATRWIVPTDAVGWAVNSAGAGEPGNVIIVGHQALGEALFRPLALGEVEPGQAIELLTADGKRYEYKVSEESAPLPAIGATAEEKARAAAYFEPGTTPKLTLVTGWPADTSTHRVFVVADYVGERP